ncbi:23243_t:CDS:2 [Dentiscutata erythropus]|uniref:23243_t:CDS:1 n=1 Tax=Dentiscutata erythropus TaxID=1348616 RepID=A0A9N9I8H0_9GLOM|nr:23243_t:CDS:2 [Dentiscutata erythropus]
MLPKYSTYQQSYEQGGLQAPIIGNLLDARALMVWLKLLSGNTFWAKPGPQNRNPTFFLGRKQIEEFSFIQIGLKVSKTSL